MYINQIESDATITISTGNLDLESRIVSIDEKNIPTPLIKFGKTCPYIVSEAILVGNKVLAFDTTAKPRVSYIFKEKVFSWNPVVIKAFMSKNCYFFIIYSLVNAEEINRRRGYRVWVGVDGLVQKGLTNDYTKVLIKDISTTGIAFVSAYENINSKVGNYVHIKFEDSYKFDIQACIVRNEPTEKGTILYGCTFAKEKHDLLKYINEKQREKINMNKSTPLHKGKEK